MELADSRGDVAGALGDDGRRLVVVGLVQESAARIEVPPHVAGEDSTHLAQPWDQRFGVHLLGNAMPPANGVQCAEEVRHQREGGARANVPRGAGEPAERGPARMADHIRFLEAADAVLGLVVGGRVIAGLGEGIRCAQRRHFRPGVAPGIRIAGDDCGRHVVADLDRRLHLAAMRAAEQPGADPDDLVFEALRGKGGGDDGGAVDRGRGRGREAEGGGRRCQAAEVEAGHQRVLLALAISSRARGTSGSP